MNVQRLPLVLLLIYLGLAQSAAARAETADPARGVGTADAWSPGGQDNDRLEWWNEKVFGFNRAFDRFLLKPVALTYAAVFPMPAQEGLRRAIDNLDVVRKVANHTLQGSPARAGRELARFIVNSTVGVAGIFDVGAKMGLASSDPDMGITLGVYGIAHGPYLVLPLLPPTTLRDGVGRVADSFMNPLGYFAPSSVTLSVQAVDIVNSRALNREAFEALEQSIDPYSAARDAYLQVRQRRLQAARRALEPKPVQ